MFVFSKSIGEKTGNAEVNQWQFNNLQNERNASAQAVADFLARTRFGENGHLDAVNAVDDIRRLYRAFDTTVLQQFEPNTEFTLLNDLMPLSRSVRIEQSRYDYARTGGRGWAHTGLNIDFTSGTATSQQIRAGAIALRDQMRRINSQYAEQTWYVSGEIISNLERYFSDNFQSGTIMDEILKLTGVAAIKEDSQLTGNEIVIVPLGAGVIAPIVGQAIGTVASPRPEYNSDYIWRTWGAMGLMVKQDINNKYSVIHASS